MVFALTADNGNVDIGDKYLETKRRSVDNDNRLTNQRALYTVDRSFATIKKKNPSLKQITVRK